MQSSAIVRREGERARVSLEIIWLDEGEGEGALEIVWLEEGEGGESSLWDEKRISAITQRK